MNQPKMVSTAQLCEEERIPNVMDVVVDVFGAVALGVVVNVDAAVVVAVVVDAAERHKPPDYA